MLQALLTLLCAPFNHEKTLPKWLQESTWSQILTLRFLGFLFSYASILFGIKYLSATVHIQYPLTFNLLDQKNWFVHFMQHVPAYVFVILLMMAAFNFFYSAFVFKLCGKHYKKGHEGAPTFRHYLALMLAAAMPIYIFILPINLLEQFYLYHQLPQIVDKMSPALALFALFKFIIAIVMFVVVLVMLYKSLCYLQRDAAGGRVILQMIAGFILQIVGATVMFFVLIFTVLFLGAATNLFPVDQIKAFHQQYHNATRLDYLLLQEKKGILPTTDFNSIAVIYSTGGYGVKKDNAKSIAYFRKGAAEKDSYAMSNLASAYLVGDGVSKDPKKAYDLLTAAYTQDPEDANYCVNFLLAEVNARGLAGPVNQQQASKFYANAYYGYNHLDPKAHATRLNAKGFVTYLFHGHAGVPDASIAKDYQQIYQQLYQGCY